MIEDMGKFLTLGCLVSALMFGQAPKKKITGAADLPKFQYTIKGKVEDLITSDEAFRPFSAQLRKDVDSVLRDYDISDAATKRGLLAVLASLDVLEGKDEDARRRLTEIKALEEKPAAKAISGMITSAILDARRTNHDHNSPAYRQAVYQALKKSLDALPFDVVQNDLKSLKAGVEMMTQPLIMGQVQASMDPVVAKTGGISSDMANALPSMKLLIAERLPIRDTINEALSTYLTANAKEKRDIWAARDVTLEPGKHHTVNVAVWDSGVDINIFKDRIVKDASGQPAVIAYDINTRKTTGYLFPLNPEQQRRFPEATKELKGLSDMQANVESPESAAVKQQMSKMSPDQVKPFLEELSLFGDYSHGTHVAGILMAGNPYARLVVGRLTFDWKMIPDPCPSRAQAERDSASMVDYVNFFKANKVQVVNMSWGGTIKEEED